MSRSRTMLTRSVVDTCADCGAVGKLLLLLEQLEIQQVARSSVFQIIFRSNLGIYQQRDSYM